MRTSPRTNPSSIVMAAPSRISAFVTGPSYAVVEMSTQTAAVDERGPLHRAQTACSGPEFARFGTKPRTGGARAGLRGDGRFGVRLRLAGDRVLERRDGPAGGVGGIRRVVETRRVGGRAGL